MNDPCHASAAALARAIRSKEVSSVEVVSAHIARIEAVNPRLNAVVHLCAESALARAREADAALARGDAVGPLHGVPMTLKDNLDTAGIVTTGGTRGRAAFVPARDATVVARMRAAGAILLGKTNTPELTLSYETDNLVHGRTNHPQDPSLTCGGSSGGAAAILAAGGSPMDIGSDTGGSIRVPSHYCGTAGLRPTSGRVSRAGHIIPPGGFIDWMTQIGPMARRVEDLGLILSIIAGEDDLDPAVVPAPLGSPGDVDVRSLRVAVHTDNGVAPPTADTVATVKAAAEALAGAGLAVTEARPPGVERTVPLFLGLTGADGGAGLEALLDAYGTTEPSPAVAALIAEMRAELVSTAQFNAMITELDALRTGMLSFMREYDVILCPVSATPALPHGSSYSEQGLANHSYAQTFNLTGWPAAVVRAGTSAEGLPIGVQIAARPWREHVALAAALRIERALGGWKPLPAAPTWPQSP